MSIQESIRIVPRGEIALVEWDLVGEKVNKLSTPVMTRFKEVLDELSRSSFKAVVMISRKSSIFIAGADIEEIKAMKTREQIMPALTSAHEVFNFLEDLKMPVIAAIHGACLGGGCELVLACDYRIATDDSSTRIGLPEVKLGIIPGFGGCVRLPRVVGLQASLDIILQGKSVDGNRAMKMGLVDQVVHPSLLESQALKFAEQLVREGRLNKRKKRFEARGLMPKLMESAILRGKVFSEAHKMTMKATSGHYPAPLKAIEVIRKTYTIDSTRPSGRARALSIEADVFGDLVVTDVSKNLINVFFLMESVKKKTGVASDAKPLPVKRIGVLGAGTMGGGVAFVAADRGIEVRLKDINNQALALGFSHARELWEKLLKRKRLNTYDFNRKMNLITGGLDFSGFGQLDVVIEAIVEDMKIKQAVIGETSKHCKSDCIIATNTSSLSVNEMSKGHPNPANFVGMHFFNPVDKMPLVEVIRGEKTSDVAVATIFELAKKMGKLPVVVKDGPGFLVNRLLLPYLIEAAWLLEDGMSVEKVDKLYKNEFGMPMGPFTLMDEIGIDVCIKVAKIFHESLGERIQIPNAMLKLKETDRLGKKNKKGFYLYDDRGKKLQFDPTVYAELGLGQPTDKLSNKEVLRRGLFPMINEAALALHEERIVESPEEVDLAMITGTGFPPFRGGLLRYADTLGSQTIADELEVFATQYGIRFKPSTPLRNMAKTNRTFY
jgi:3-hydroxyacyl-CoA dehydrogenase / enoyl-CoA hydratase / 3-hydroxybutyryl-CoA epimerase